MSWNADGTQTGINTSFAGMEDVTGVTVATLGKKKIYTLTSGTKLDIKGTLTGNPEIERLNVSSSEVNQADSGVIFVKTGGRFNFGKNITKTVNGVDYPRPSRGVLVNTLTRQLPWWNIIGGVRGKGAIIQVEDGGEFHWVGATLGGRSSFAFQPGSAVWIEDGIYNKVSGIENNEQAGSGRDTISYLAGTDLLIEKFTVLQGAEILAYQAKPSGTNSISGTANGIKGYTAKQSVIAIYPNGFTGFEMEDSELAGNGNSIDLTIQSGGGTNLSVNSAFNELGGTTLFCGAPESGTDSRNCGIDKIYRRINFDLKDGLTGVDLSGGRYFIRDNNNSDRKNLNSNDDTPDKTYSGTFTDGELPSDEPILIGIVNVECGIGRLKNTSNDPANTDSVNADYLMDKRTKSNTLGDDKMDGHLWRYENQYISLSDIDFTDGTTGTKIVEARAVADTNITNTRTQVVAKVSNLTVASDSITTTTTAVNLDDVYDIVKYTKETSEANMEIPTASTLVLDSDGSVLDLGTLTLTVGTAKWTIGANHKTIKRTTTYDASQIIQHPDLIINSPQLTNIPTIIKGRFDTAGGNISTTGGKTFNDTSFVNGLTGNWTLTTSGNTFNGIAFNSDLNITGSGDNTLNCSFDSDITLPVGDQTFGSDFEGNGNLTANGDGDWTFNTLADVSATDLDCNSSGITIDIYGKTESDFNSVGTTGTINFITLFDIGVEYPSNVTSGLLSIRNNTTGAVLFSSTSAGTIISNTAGTGKTQVVASTDLVIIFTSKDKTDYLATRTANAQASDVNITVGTNVIPNSPVAPVTSLVTPSYSTVTDKLSLSISVSVWSGVAGRDRETDTYLNEAIAKQVKETVAYQELIFNNQSDKFWISSQGSSSFIGISDKCLLTATSEVDLPYVAGFSASTGLRLVEILVGSVYTTANAPIESGSVHLAVTPQAQSLGQEVTDAIIDTNNLVNESLEGGSGGLQI